MAWLCINRWSSDTSRPTRTQTCGILPSSPVVDSVLLGAFKCVKAQALKKSTLVDDAGTATSNYPCPECSKTNARYHVLAGKYGPNELLLPISPLHALFHGCVLSHPHQLVCGISTDAGDEWRR